MVSVCVSPCRAHVSAYVRCDQRMHGGGQLGSAVARGNKTSQIFQILTRGAE